MGKAAVCKPRREASKETSPAHILILDFPASRKKMSVVYKPLINGGGGLVTQSCPTLCDSVGCSPPGSSLHEISQAIILEWVAISFSRASSQPRDQIQVSHIACCFFTSETSRKPTYQLYFCYSSLNGLRLWYSSPSKL